jgi:hypothetical protein
MPLKVKIDHDVHKIIFLDHWSFLIACANIPTCSNRMKDFGQDRRTSFPAAFLSHPPSPWDFSLGRPWPAQLCTYTRHSLPLTLMDGPPARLRPARLGMERPCPPRTRARPHSPSPSSSSLPHAEQPRSARPEVFGPLLAQHGRPRQVRPALVGTLTSQHTLPLSPTASVLERSRTLEGLEPGGCSLIGQPGSPRPHSPALGPCVTWPSPHSHQVAH